MAAISKWRSVVGVERTGAVYPILVAVAEQCQRLSDRSNETFSKLEKEDIADILANLDILKVELDKFS